MERNGMPAVVKFERSLIENYIKARNWRFLTDSDGDLVVNFSSDADTGYEWTVYFILGGQKKEIYQMLVRARKDFPKAEWPRILMLCNEWNKVRRWPKSYLDIPGDEKAADARIILEASMDLETGIHQELFNDFSDTIFSCSIQFWKWAHLEHGL
jgi:hypothetical protein